MLYGLLFFILNLVCKKLKMFSIFSQDQIFFCRVESRDFIKISKQLLELFPEYSETLWYSPYQKPTAGCPKEIGAGGWLYKEYKNIRKELRLAKRLTSRRSEETPEPPEKSKIFSFC